MGSCRLPGCGGCEDMCGSDDDSCCLLPPPPPPPMRSSCKLPFRFCPGTLPRRPDCDDVDPFRSWFPSLLPPPRIPIALLFAVDGALPLRPVSDPFIARRLFPRASQLASRSGVLFVLLIRLLAVVGMPATIVYIHVGVWGSAPDQSRTLSHTLPTPLYLVGIV